MTFVRAVNSRVATLTIRRLQSPRSTLAPWTIRRTLVAAPRPGSGPLLERRSDRELPEISRPSMRWIRTFPIFLAILVSCTLAIFNYQKASSSVVASTLYALRTSPKAREYLGDEIYFAHQMPWIRGEMNQLHGRIDIRFRVKGNSNDGMMRFKSAREKRSGVWETAEWSLEKPDGSRIDLLDREDPFRALEISEEEVEARLPGRGTYRPSTEA